MSTLRERDTVLRELMDDPDCATPELERTYRDFRAVNRLVSGWRRAYRQIIRPHLMRRSVTSLLDIGSGGGDVPLALARWAERDGFALDVTAIDPDGRAHRYATRAHGNERGNSTQRNEDPATQRHGQDRTSVEFRCASSADLVAEGRRFDIVVSNHVLHHLDRAEFAEVLSDSRRLARSLVLHNDIERSPVAYSGYWLATLPLSLRPSARRSFIREDGLRSIRRSYTKVELDAEVADAAAGDEWRVSRAYPSRLLLTAPGGAP